MFCHSRSTRNGRRTAGCSANITQQFTVVPFALIHPCGVPIANERYFPRGGPRALTATNTKRLKPKAYKRSSKVRGKKPRAEGTWHAACGLGQHTEKVKSFTPHGPWGATKTRSYLGDAFTKEQFDIFLGSGLSSSINAFRIDRQESQRL
jgi:hypothetical protein